MPRAYSLDLRQRLIDAVEAGSSPRAAARRLQVSASTAVECVQRNRETGSVEAKPMHGLTPAKLLPHMDWLIRLVADEPDLTLKQIGEHLVVNGIHVSKSCIHTFLWRIDVLIARSDQLETSLTTAATVLCSLRLHEEPVPVPILRKPPL